MHKQDNFMNFKLHFTININNIKQMNIKAVHYQIGQQLKFPYSVIVIEPHY